MKANMHLWSYLDQFFSEWEMFQTKGVEKIKTHISCSTPFFFRKLCRLWDKKEKFCRAGQVTDCNKAHAHCMLDTYDYKHALKIWNANCCSTATIVAQTWTLPVLFFLSRFDPMRGHNLPSRGYVITVTKRITLGRTPLDEWKPKADTSTRQHTTITTDRYPCPRRDSNPQS
jgi:hypothetical protein